MCEDDDIVVFFNLFVLLYADDTIILAESELDLQLALNAMQMYCSDWNLTVNVKKTKIVIFSRGKVKKYRQFMFNNEVVEVVDKYCYLGFILNYNGKFWVNIQKLQSLATRAMFGLLQKDGTRFKCEL